MRIRFDKEDKSLFTACILERRASTIEKYLDCKIIDNSIKVLSGTEIAYGSWYDLDEEENIKYEKYLNRIFNTKGISKQCLDNVV